MNLILRVAILIIFTIGHLKTCNGQSDDIQSIKITPTAETVTVTTATKLITVTTQSTSTIKSTTTSTSQLTTSITTQSTTSMKTTQSTTLSTTQVTSTVLIMATTQSTKLLTRLTTPTSIKTTQSTTNPLITSFSTTQMAKTTQQSTTFIQTNQSSKTTITLPNNKNLSVFKSITDESSTRITQATKTPKLLKCFLCEKCTEINMLTQTCESDEYYCFKDTKTKNTIKGCAKICIETNSFKCCSKDFCNYSNKSNLINKFVFIVSLLFSVNFGFNDYFIIS